MSGWTVAMAGTAAAAFLAALGTFGFGSASADGDPTPVAEVYVEGTLAEGPEGCVMLQNMVLLGDLGGFGVGDDVRVWGNVFVGITICLQDEALEVKKIASLGPVGGIAELPQVEGALQKADGSVDGSAGILAGIATTAAVVALALGGAVWYVLRRRAT